jgi:hypothetical protein
MQAVAASRFSVGLIFGGLSSGSAIVNVISPNRRLRVQIAPDVREPVTSTDAHFEMLQFYYFPTLPLIFFAIVSYSQSFIPMPNLFSGVPISLYSILSIEFSKRLILNLTHYFALIGKTIAQRSGAETHRWHDALPRSAAFRSGIFPSHIAMTLLACSERIHATREIKTIGLRAE